MLRYDCIAKCLFDHSGVILDPGIVRFESQRFGYCDLGFGEIPFSILDPRECVSRVDVLSQVVFTCRNREGIVEPHVIIGPHQCEAFLIVVDADLGFNDLDEVVILLGFFGVSLFRVNVTEQDKCIDVRDAFAGFSEKRDRGVEIVKRFADTPLSDLGEIIIGQDGQGFVVDLFTFGKFTVFPEFVA